MHGGAQVAPRSVLGHPGQFEVPPHPSDILSGNVTLLFFFWNSRKSQMLYKSRFLGSVGTGGLKKHAPGTVLDKYCAERVWLTAVTAQQSRIIFKKFHCYFVVPKLKILGG